MRIRKSFALIFLFFILFNSVNVDAYYKENGTRYLSSYFGDENSVVPETVSGEWNIIEESGSVYKEYDFSQIKDLKIKTGAVSVSDGELVGNSTGGATETFFGDEEFSDFEIELDVTNVESDGGGSTSVALRYVDSNNRTSVLLNENGSLQVMKVRNGIRNYPLITSGIEVGKKARLRIRCSGSQIYIWIDGRLKAQAQTILDQPRGKCGFMSWKMAYKADNVKISKPKPYGFGKRYAHTKDNEKAYAIAGDSDMTDVSIAVSAAFKESAGAGIALRADRSGNGYFAVFDGKTAKIEKRKNGVKTELSKTALTLEDYMLKTVKLIADGKKLILEADNKQILSAEDADFKSGYAAFFSDGSEIIAERYWINKLDAELKKYTSLGHRTYYVSAEGDDSNDGLNEKRAWKSIDKVNSVEFKPGDKILFRRGDEFFGYLKINKYSGKDDSGITYGAYGDSTKDKPILYNNGTVVTIEDVSHITVENLKVFTKCNTGRLSMNFGGGSGINIKANQNKTPNILMEDITVRDCEIYSNTADSYTYGIVYGVNYKKSTCTQGDCFIKNVRIEDNYTHDLGVYGIGTVSWNTDKGGGESHVEGMLRNVHISGNRVERISSIGLCINGVSDSVIERNVIKQCGIYNKEDSPKWGVGGCFIGNSANCIIRFNEFSESRDGSIGIDAGGFGLDWGIHDVTFIYNETHHNMGAGIHTMGNHDNQILYNKIHHNYELTSAVGGVGITDYKGTGDIKGQKNMYVKGNVITLNYDRTVGIALQNTSNNGFSGISYEDNTIVISKEPEEDEMTRTHTKSSESRYYSSDGSIISGTPMRLVFDIPTKTSVESITGTKVFTEDGFKAAKDGIVYETREEWLEKTGFGDSLEVVNSINNTKPDKPKNFSAEAKPFGIALKWEAVSGAAHYNIYRGEMPDFESRYITMIGEAHNGEVGFTDRDTEEGKTYYYRIEAENECGINGSSSDTVSVIAIKKENLQSIGYTTVFDMTGGDRPNRLPDSLEGLITRDGTNENNKPSVESDRIRFDSTTGRGDESKAVFNMPSARNYDVSFKVRFTKAVSGTLNKYGNMRLCLRTGGTPAGTKETKYYAFNMSSAPDYVGATMYRADLGLVTDKLNVYGDRIFKLNREYEVVVKTYDMPDEPDSVKTEVYLDGELYSEYKHKSEKDYSKKEAGGLEFLATGTAFDITDLKICVAPQELMRVYETGEESNKRIEAEFDYPFTSLDSVDLDELSVVSALYESGRLKAAEVFPAPAVKLKITDEPVVGTYDILKKRGESDSARVFLWNMKKLSPYAVKNTIN